MPLLEKNDVTVIIESTERSWLTALIMGLLPWLLILGFFFCMQKKALEHLRGGAGGIFGFTQSESKRYDRETSQAHIKVSIRRRAWLRPTMHW